MERVEKYYYKVVVGVFNIIKYYNLNKDRSANVCIKNCG